MFCPNCGQSNSTEQAFCRQCGLNLQKTAESLTEQLPDRLSKRSGLGDQRLELLGRIAFGGLGIAGLLAVAGMLYAIFTKFILSGDGVLTGIIFMLLLIFAVLGLVFVVINESKKERRSMAATDANLAENERKDTGQLLTEGDFEPVPSVIEDTTKLLKVEAKTRKL